MQILVTEDSAQNLHQKFDDETKKWMVAQLGATFKWFAKLLPTTLHMIRINYS